MFANYVRFKNLATVYNLFRQLESSFRSQYCMPSAYMCLQTHDVDLLKLL